MQPKTETHATELDHDFPDAGLVEPWKDASEFPQKVGKIA
jgi:hypothetical protein